MLFDRFDNMRSKVIVGGGEGYDLTKIGESAIVIAQSSIGIGKKFEGIRNENLQFDLYSQAFTKPTYVSEDLQVGIQDTPIGTSSQSTKTSIPILFWNPQTNNYDEVQIPKPENYSFSNSFTYKGLINEDGTLATLSFNGGIIWIEIERENKTGACYYQAINYSDSDQRKFLSKNLFLGRYSTNSNIAMPFVYDRTTHQATMLSLISGGSTIPYTAIPTDNLPNSVIWNENIMITNKKEVFNFTSTTYQYLTNQISVSDSKFIFSKNGNYILGYNTSNSTMNLYSFNIVDLSVSLIATFDETSLGVSGISSYNAYISGNYLLRGLYVWDITDTSNPTLLYSNSVAFDIRGFKWFININKFINYTDSKLYSALQSSNASYVIYSYNSNSISSDKVYGITSKALTLGEVGNAQILWSTLTTP